MKKFCEKVLWLEYGVLKEYGEAEEVLKNMTVSLRNTQK